MAVVELVIAGAAIPGGAGLIRDGMGMRPEWIEHSLLGGWAVPGALLIVLIGGGMLWAASMALVRPCLAGPASLMMGAILALWLVVETLVIGWHGGPQWLLDGLKAGSAALLVALASPSFTIRGRVPR